MISSVEHCYNTGTLLSTEMTYPQKLYGPRHYTAHRRSFTKDWQLKAEAAKQQTNNHQALADQQD